MYSGVLNRMKSQKKKEKRIKGFTFVLPNPKKNETLSFKKLSLLL